MRKRFWRNVASAFFVSAIGATMLASPAQADTTPPECATDAQMQSGNGNCTADVTAESSSHDVAQGHVTSVSGVTFTSATQTHVIAYIQAHGATHQQMQGRKIKLKHSGCYNTSYHNLSGAEVWHRKCYPAGYTFVKGSDGYYHDPHCWNKVTGLPRGPKAPPRGHIQLYGHYKIVSAFKFSTSAEAVLEQNSVSRATAWANGYLYDYQGNLVLDGNGNPIQTCHAEAHAKASAYFKAVGKASLQGRIFATWTAAVHATVSGANADLNSQLGGRTHIQVIGQTWASARGKAVTDASAQATCTNTYQPQPGKAITITSMTDLNLIAAGMNSGPYEIKVNASEAGGSVTVDPGIGAVSDCNGGALQGSMTFSNLGSGNTTLCVVIWAPNDADHPASMTVTTTATLGSSTDVKTDQVNIQYPVRP